MRPAQQSSPSVLAILKEAAPDKRTENLTKVNTWLMQGKAPATTGNFQKIDGVIPWFWDEDIRLIILVELGSAAHRLLSQDPIQTCLVHEGG